MYFIIKTTPCRHAEAVDPGLKSNDRSHLNAQSCQGVANEILVLSDGCALQDLISCDHFRRIQLASEGERLQDDDFFCRLKSFHGDHSLVGDFLLQSLC
jgi:hypothetical protein